MPSDASDVQSIAAAIEAEQLPWTAGPTELAALPPQEQQRYLGLIITPEEQRRLAEQREQAIVREQRLSAGLMAAPAAHDWRDVNGQDFVTPVKNQGGCGSCVSFCTCAVMESAVRIKLQNPTHAIDLSEAFCQFCGGGSCAGWGLTAGLDFARSTGVTDNACMPYQPTDMNCAASRCADWQNRLTKITGYTSYATAEARKAALVASGPLLAGMAVYSDFYAYTGGVYVKTSAASLSGYHCITLVGYDDSQQCWILKNSWGQNWGDGGFCRVGYNQPELLIDSQWMFYSVVINIAADWHNNIAVVMAYASRDSRNAWANLQGLGWRRIEAGSADSVTNMLMLFAEALTHNRPVNVYADGDFVYQAHML